jgi:hypothetical protein
VFKREKAKRNLFEKSGVWLHFAKRVIFVSIFDSFLFPFLIHFYIHFSKSNKKVELKRNQKVAKNVYRE